ncbi:MAG: FAD-binding oxidoreductase [Stellaceae bacterium]
MIEPPQISAEQLAVALQEWRARLGAAAVLEGPTAQQRYGRCTTGHARVIPAGLRPCSVPEIVAILEVARRYAIALYPISTGHNWGYGSAVPVSDGCVVLDLSGLDRILDMDAELGLVTVEPGVTQRMLHEFLERNRLPFLVPVTGGGPNCSLVGNALERGYGITPYADHTAAVTAIEAVLPNGRIYRSALSEAGGELANRAFKWGIGLYLDGLFAQGNLGIVTRMTIALARRPERIEAFLFSIAQEPALVPVVPAVQRLLRELGGVAGAVNLMNSRRMLAMITPYPELGAASDGILPPERVAAMAAQHRVMAWTGFGALYGTAAVVRAARRTVRRVLRPVVSRLTFMTPRGAARLHNTLSWVPRLRHGPLTRRARALDAAMQLVAGHPSEIALPLAYWRSAPPPADAELDPARDGSGLIWYSPLVPMRAELVARYVGIVGEVCAAYAIEPLITLTSLSERCFDSSVPLLFDTSDPGAAARARSCYLALLDAGRREGFLPYRLSAHEMGWLTAGDAPCWEMAAAIKAALDPDGMIAPGRYVGTGRPPG